MKRAILPITISPNAWRKINSVLNGNKYYSFLFSAKSGGCNGFNYNFEAIDKSNFDDRMKKLPTPIYIHKCDGKLIIDPSSELLLIGTTIDFIEENHTKIYLKVNSHFLIPKN